MKIMDGSTSLATSLATSLMKIYLVHKIVLQK